ncbi:MAG: hypothetical protein J6L72_06155 [Butyricicoccus sp.]|nr:hypothetical protein [Butyricicoccus sp.]
MRLKVIFAAIVFLLLAVISLGAIWFVPYYQALYASRAIRYDGRLFLPTNDVAGVRRYTDGERTVCFQSVAGNTQVTLDFPGYTPALFFVSETDDTVTVSRRNSTPDLEGIWKNGELTDIQTGRTQSIYAFEILSDAPSPSLALCLYETEKDGIRGKPGIKLGIITCFCASFGGLCRLAIPVTKTEKQMFVESPMLRRGLLLFLCIFPFAAVPVILYWAVT